MAVLKLSRGTYRNEDAVDNLINYLLNKEKMPSWCFGGTGISFDRPAYCMHTVKETFGQVTGKQCEHVILAFNDEELSRLTMPIIVNLAYDICEFFEGMQVMFVLHEKGDDYFDEELDTKNPHLHFAINTVDVRTGNKFNINYNNEFDLMRYTENLLIHYNIGDTIKLYVH